VALRLSVVLLVLLSALGAVAATGLRPPEAAAAIGVYPGELCLRYSRLHRCA
jgi:hypothetical protein